MSTVSGQKSRCNKSIGHNSMDNWTGGQKCWSIDWLANDYSPLHTHWLPVALSGWETMNSWQRQLLVVMQLFMVMVPIRQSFVSAGVVLEVPIVPLTWWLEVTLSPVSSYKVIEGYSWSSLLQQGARKLILVLFPPTGFLAVYLGPVSSKELLGG